MYKGFYLNLDRNESRRTALIRHLESIGLSSRYERIAAVEGRAVADQHPTKLDHGNLGLWLTHEKLLRANLESAVHLHILEDDALLADDALDRFQRILSLADAQRADWDLIFTDIVPPMDVSFFNFVFKLLASNDASKEAVLLDLKPVLFCSTASFFINRRSIKKYHELISGKWSIGLPIDLFIRESVRKDLLKAHVTIPFLTTVSPETAQSDIRGNLDLSRRVSNVYRRAMFKDADLNALNQEIDELCRDTKVPELRQIFIKAMSFSWSDKYVHY